MCALRAHIKLSAFENIFSGIEKAVITFSILEKFFSALTGFEALKNWVRLMCVLRAHIKFSVFGNIFSKIEKAVITFLILKKIFSKNKN